MEKVKADLQTKGDLGLVAEASRSTQRTMLAPPKLTVRGVFAKLKEIASMAGHSVSQKSRVTFNCISPGSPRVCMM